MAADAMRPKRGEHFGIGGGLRRLGMHLINCQGMATSLWAYLMKMLPNGFHELCARPKRGRGGLILT